MRILHLTDFYPPTLGGLELQVQWLARDLARRGHETAVVCMAPGGRPSVEMDEGVSVHRVAGWSRAFLSRYGQADRPYHPPFPDPGVARSLARILEAERPDVVHAHTWALYSYLPVRKHAAAACVVSLHEYGLVCPKKSYVYRDGTCTGPGPAKCVACAAGQYGWVGSAGLTAGLNLMRPLRRSVDRFVANSASVAGASREGLARGAEIEVIPPFLPDRLFEIPRGPRPAFLPEGDCILFVGALGPHKGLDALFEAHASLRPRTPLVLIGTRRPDTPRRFPSGVEVIENLPHAEVMQAWAHCAVGVVPSLWPEPFGVVAVEAMAAGRPVVASAVGGLQDIVVEGETGFLVPPGDPGLLREAMAVLLEDVALRRRMGSAARRRAATFAASVVVPRIEGVYRQAQARRVGRPGADGPQSEARP